MLLLTALVLAQTAAPMTMPMDKPEPVCVRAGDLPPAFANWNAAPRKPVILACPVVMTARPAPGVKWAAPAGKPGNGAVAWFRISTPGTYQIGLSNGAWIDLVAKGKTVTSLDHRHGPLCTGLRKIVDFRLARGMYALQLAGMPAAETKVMVVRK